MGFVDFTPKKMSIIEKSVCQYDLFFDKRDAEIKFLEKYMTQNEGELSLYQQMYPEKFNSSTVHLEMIIPTSGTSGMDHNRPMSLIQVTSTRNKS